VIGAMAASRDRTARHYLTNVHLEQGAAAKSARGPQGDGYAALDRLGCGGRSAPSAGNGFRVDPDECMFRILLKTRRPRCKTCQIACSVLARWPDGPVIGGMSDNMLAAGAVSWNPRVLISVLLALVTVVGVGGALWNRVKLCKGIGWQFISYSVILVAVPLTGILALNGALKEGSAAILAGALGYAFGKQDGADD